MADGADRPHRPQLWVVAGPNGAGKSTIASGRLAAAGLPFVNPDDIARDLPRRPDGKLDELAAGKIALTRRVAHLTNREHFGIETTLSGTGPLRLIREAKTAGYKVNLVYIGLTNVSVSATRVGQRIAMGGHDVPSEALARRYPDTMKNLATALDIADRAYVLDNSGERRRLLLTRAGDQTKHRTWDMPAWAEAAIPEALRQALARSTGSTPNAC